MLREIKQAEKTLYVHFKINKTTKPPPNPELTELTGVCQRWVKWVKGVRLPVTK